MKMKAAWTLAILLSLPSGHLVAQTSRAGPAVESETQRERRGLDTLLAIVERNVVGAADVMPADKYSFAPTEGEFRGVRTFGRQVKHLAATNYILAAAALGEDAPAGAGDEAGPDSVNTKAEILDYVRGSFAQLRKAVDRIGEPHAVVRSSPISPFQGGTATRLALTVEALIHAYDHYGQLVEYLRMNGIIPPASRP